MELLLKSPGIDIDAQDDKGSTALMGACYNEHLSVMEVLLQAGADVNIQTEGGYTALMFASSDGKFKVR